MRPPVDLPRLQECSDGTADGVRTLVGIFLSIDGSATLMCEVDDELSRVAKFLESYVDSAGERP